MERPRQKIQENIQTINEFSAPSVKQQEDASNITPNLLVPCDMSNMGDSDLRELETTSESNNYTIQRSYTQTMTCNKLQSAENPVSFFSGASISGGNITINVMPSRKRKLEVSSESSQ